MKQIIKAINIYPKQMIELILANTVLRWNVMGDLCGRWDVDGGIERVAPE